MIHRIRIFIGCCLIATPLTYPFEGSIGYYIFPWKRNLPVDPMRHPCVISITRAERIISRWLNIPVLRVMRVRWKESRHLIQRREYEREFAKITRETLK